MINACHSVYIESLGEYMYQNSNSLNELEKKFNVIIRHYPKEITKKMLTISRDVVRSFSNLGKVHNEIYSSWEENLKKFNRYQEFGDYGYVQNRLQVSSYE